MSVGLAATLVLVACVRPELPVSMPLVEAEARPPVIFVPGVTGVTLIDASSGATVWGTGRNLVTPHDRGYGTARAIVEASTLPQLEAGEAIREISLWGVFRKTVYRRLIEFFEANGYRTGDLRRPAPDDSFFLFAYDWRQDNISSARLLGEQLEAVRRARGEDSLGVVLICQSNGAHICRFFAKFGAVSLEEAESGLTGSRRLAVDKLILVGSSTGGSLRILRELNRGRRYIRPWGRLWSPETLSTFVSLYQDLPAYSRDLFVDEDGRTLAVDLFDVETWQRFGWGIFGTSPQRHLAQPKAPAVFGTPTDQRSFVETALQRASRLHAVLLQDTSRLAGMKLYLVENLGQPTASRAVLACRDSEQTWFPGDPELRRRPELERLITEPGDGHATATSQRWLSPGERARLARESAEVAGEHHEAVLQRATLKHLLDFLED